MYPKINRFQFVIPITIWRKLPMEGIQTTSPKSRQKTPLKLFQRSSASRHQTAWFPRCSFFCRFFRWAHEVRHPMHPRGATEDSFPLESFGDTMQHRYFERQSTVVSIDLSVGNSPSTLSSVVWISFVNRLGGFGSSFEIGVVGFRPPVWSGFG